MELVTVWAAFLVCSKWCNAFCSLIVNAKISVATIMRSEMMKVPQKAQMTPMILPKVVTGYMSPYPTVVMVMITHHTDEKYVSKRS